jgi:hypothetical protein
MLINQALPVPRVLAGETVRPSVCVCRLQKTPGSSERRRYLGVALRDKQR